MHLGPWLCSLVVTCAVRPTGKEIEILETRSPSWLEFGAVTGEPYTTDDFFDQQAVYMKADPTVFSPAKW